MDSGCKRNLEPSLDVEVQTIKLYRTAVNYSVGNGSTNGGDPSNLVDQSKHLKLRKGEAEHIYKFFCGLQLTNPSSFYVMDLNDEGHLRNVFWIDSRSRAAYTYFGDVILIETTYLSNCYEIPLLVFTGVNHHRQSILLGCALLVDESVETYIWLLRAWLLCMLGCPPQTVISDRNKALQSAISEVFPRAHHRLCLPLVIQNILEKLGEVGESEVFCTILARTVYNSLKVDEFERAWEEMIQHFGLKDHEWLQTWYDDRERWARLLERYIFGRSVYFSARRLVDRFLGGLLTFLPFILHEQRT